MAGAVAAGGAWMDLLLKKRGGHAMSAAGVTLKKKMR